MDNMYSFETNNINKRSDTSYIYETSQALSKEKEVAGCIDLQHVLSKSDRLPQRIASMNKEEPLKLNQIY